MKPVKRVEIIIESLHARDVIRAIELAGIDGYTLIRDVAGRGDRGDRSGDDLTDASRNCCFIVAADPERAPALLEALGPLLKTYGGVCLVTDSQWLWH